MIWKRYGYPRHPTWAVILTRQNTPLGAASFAIIVKTRHKRQAAPNRRGDGAVGRESKVIQHNQRMTEPMTKTDRRRAAIHEAGHAVVALHLGAELQPKRCMLFEPCGCGTTFSRRPEDPRQQAVMLMAGLASEHLLGVLTDDSIGAAERDVVHLTEVLACSREELLGTCWRALHEQATMILQHYRPAVEAIAKALVEKGALDGAEVEALFRANGRAP